MKYRVLTAFTLVAGLALAECDPWLEDNCVTDSQIGSREKTLRTDAAFFGVVSFIKSIFNICMTAAMSSAFDNGDLSTIKTISWVTASLSFLLFVPVGILWAL